MREKLNVARQGIIRLSIGDASQLVSDGTERQREEGCEHSMTLREREYGVEAAEEVGALRAEEDDWNGRYRRLISGARIADRRYIFEGRELGVVRHCLSFGGRAGQEQVLEWR